MNTKTSFVIAAALAAFVALPGQASAQNAGAGLALGQSGAAPLALAISPETEYPKLSGPAKKRTRIKSRRGKKPAARKINPKGFDASDDERTLKRKAKRSGKTNPRGFDASDDE